MRCTASRDAWKRLLLFSFGTILVLAASAAPVDAVCLANNKPCGAPITANDRLCCPGSICGPWGNVCQPGCRINGVAYRAGTLNPANACQVCTPTVSTTAWSNAANGSACSDGNRCTQTDRCQSGTCVGSNPVVCYALDQCHDPGICNPATGTCSNPNKTDGTPCNDYNACTQTDTCQSGNCAGGNPIVCPAPDQCHYPGTCNPGTGICSNPSKPDGTVCDDGLLCTQSDVCVGGSCAGSPVLCPADPCTDPCHLAGSCDPGTGACVKPDAPDGTPCSDGDICTLDACVAGVCTPQVPNPTHDSCSNGIKDCGELDVDCGGPCAQACPFACPGPCTAIACDPGSTVCGAGQGGRDCLCTQTTEGDCFCTDRPLCPLPACNTSADCAAGEKCLETCGGCANGFKLCFPGCGTLPPLTLEGGGFDPLKH